MKTKTSLLLTGSFLCVFGLMNPLAPVCQGQATGAPRPQAKLSVGDPAPALHVEKWVRGPAVSQFEPGKIYVLDLWATWCGPCLAQMPHLTRLQQRYSDGKVQVIGLTCPDDYGNTLSAVEKIVQEKSGKIAYTIAWDAPSKEAYLGVFKGETTQAYMKAARVTWFPLCYVVDGEQRIAYIGHPQALAEVLQKLTAGKWDRQAEARRYTALREAETELTRYQELLKAVKYAEAYALAQKLLVSPLKDDPRSMLIVSDAIVGSESKVREKNLKIALAAATRAVALTHQQEPGMLGELARVYYLRGNGTQAIRLTRQAISIAEGGQKTALEKDLRAYQARKSNARP